MSLHMARKDGLSIIQYLMASALIIIQKQQHLILQWIQSMDIDNVMVGSSLENYSTILYITYLNMGSDASVQQQQYSCKKRRQDPIVRNARLVLNKIRNDKTDKIQVKQLGELADVVRFHQDVSADVRTYWAKYIGKYKLNHRATFWQKARVVIQSAIEREEQLNTQLKEMQKQLAGKTKTEAEMNKTIEVRQTQIKSNNLLSKQQEEALTKILQSTIRGEVRLFKQSNNSQKYSYLKGNSYQQIDYYLKQYNLSEEILRPLLAESLKFQQLQLKMQKLIGINSAKQKEVSVADRCSRHWQKIEQLYFYYKKNELNKQKVQIIEEAIKSTCKGIPYEAKNNQRYENILAHEKIARIISPVVQIHQSQKKLYEILQSMVEIENGFVQNTSKPTIERCIQIANQMQKMINSKGSQLNKLIGDHTKLPVNTLSELFTQIEIWKRLKSYKKYQTQVNPMEKISDKNKQSPSKVPAIKSPQGGNSLKLRFQQLFRLNKKNEIKLDSEAQHHVSSSSKSDSHDMRLLELNQKQQLLNARNQVLSEIENTGKLAWVEFVERFDIRDKHDVVQNANNITNKSFAELVIRKVLQSIQKSAQLLSNTVCEALSMNRNQLATIEQLTLTNQKQESQKMKLLVDNSKYSKYCQVLENQISQLQAKLEELQIKRNNYASQNEEQKNKRKALEDKKNGLFVKLVMSQFNSWKLKEQKVKWEQQEAKYQQDIKEKQTEIEKFSTVNVNLADCNKKTQQQNKILRAQISQLHQQVLQLETKLTQRQNKSQTKQSLKNDYKTAYIQLKDEVDSCIRKAEGLIVVDNKNIRSVTKLYERMENAWRHELDGKRHYKQLLNKLQQQNGEYQRGLQNIKKLVQDSTIKTMSDIQIKIKQIFTNKQKADHLLKSQKQAELNFKRKVLDMLQGPSQKVEGEELETLIFGALSKIKQAKSNITSAIKREPAQMSNRPSLMTQHKKSKGQLDNKVEEPKQRNLSSTKGLERQLKDMKEKIQKHEKSIKILQSQNEQLLQIIRKCDPDNQVLKLQPIYTSPSKNKPQNQNRIQAVKFASNPVVDVLEQNSNRSQIQASVIVAQIMNDMIRQVEINYTKNIEDLLTNGKEAYKKLKEKDSKLANLIEQKQKKLRELDEQIQKKILQLTNISLQISSKSQMMTEIQFLKQEMEQLNKDKKQLIEEMQRQRKELQDKLIQEKQGLSRDLQKEKQDLMKVRKESKQTIQKQRQELTKIKTQASKSKQQVQKSKNVMSAAITKRNQVDRQVMTKQKQLRQLAEKEKKIKEQLKKAEEELEKKNKEKQLIDDMIAQMEQTKKEEQTLKQKVNQERASLSMLEESYYQIQRKVAGAKRELSSLDEIRREYADIKSKLDNANSEYKQRQRQLISIKQSLRQYGQNEQREKAKADEIVRKISNQSKEAEKKLQKIKQEYQQAQDALTRIENDLVQRRKQGDKITTSNPSQRGFPFPQMISPADTEFITSQVLKLNPHRTIKQAKLLFKYPLMGNIATQAYRYIGERPKFIVVVKLKSGRVIAMYSQISLEQKRLVSHGNSFIASVTNRKAFYFREDCEVEHSVAICAGSRLIFGNGELLLYMGYPSYMQVDINPHMHSFKTAGQTAEVFVGQEVKSKHEVDEYEIIQVKFEEEKK